MPLKERSHQKLFCGRKKKKGLEPGRPRLMEKRKQRQETFETGAGLGERGKSAKVEPRHRETGDDGLQGNIEKALGMQ